VTRKTVEAHVRCILAKLDLPVEASENRRVHAVLAFLRADGSPESREPPTGVSSMRAARIRPNLAHMYNDEPYPLWIQAVALAVILAPTVALLVLRRRIGVMNTAAALVVWGAVAASGEHGMWAMRLAIHERSWSHPHSTVHYFMAGAYAGIAGVLLSVVALTLLREGRRSGWFTVLFVTLFGGSLELVMNGPTGRLYHHIGLYGYVAAWVAALAIAYAPTFTPSHTTAALSPP
jgi:hypothetical protein